MVEQAKKIWSYPSTDYHPAQQELESCTLDDEDADLTGRVLQRYSYQTVEQPAASWADMFEYMVKYLHQKGQVCSVSNCPRQRLGSFQLCQC